MNAQVNVAVVAVPKATCQRMYLFTAAVVPSAIIPLCGAEAAEILPLVAPLSAAKLGFVFVLASSSDSVTVPFDECR